jgi:hypothetical protein
MSPPAYAVALVIALIISAQTAMLMDRDHTLSQKLRALGPDAFGLLLIAALALGSAGALIGNLLAHPGPGGATGLTLAFVTWIAAVVLAHRNPPGPGKHTST